MDFKAQFIKYYTPTRGHVAVGVVGLLAGAGIGYAVSQRRKPQVAKIVRAVAEEASDNQLTLDFKKAADTLTVLASPPPTTGLIVQRDIPVGDRRPVVGQEPGVWTNANGSDKKDAAVAKAIVKEEGYDSSPQRNWEDEWDQDEENENRSPDAPYVISKREFHDGATPHRQTSLEYFAGDDILCDEQRIPIADHVKIAGRLEFGRGTDDPDVVYVRNERLDSEFEITRNHGTYAAEVLGLQAEEDADREDDQLRHSIPRFRRD